jgi:hypothetical protein
METAMNLKVDDARASEDHEGPMGQARRMAVALSDLLEQTAASAPIGHRTEVRYVEALARTLADCLGSLRERRSA